MKRWMYLIIACVSVTLIGYSMMAYANDPAGSVSKEIKGTFVSLDGQANIQIKTQNGTETIPLAKAVWVYRDQQKANLTDLQQEDQVELILNNKKQAAYIKASSPGATPTPLATPTATPSPTPATAAPTATALPSPSVQPTVSAEANSPSTQSTQALLHQAASQEDLWNKLQIQAKGEGLNLDLDQALKAKVNIYTDQQGTIYLDGQTANIFIAHLVAQIDERTISSKEQWIAAVNKQLGLNGIPMKLSDDVQWKKDKQQNKSYSHKIMKQQINNQVNYHNDDHDDGNKYNKHENKKQTFDHNSEH